MSKSGTTEPTTGQKGSATAYFILIANSVEWEPFTTGQEITETLAKHSLWLMSPLTPHRKSYREGDKVLFYVAGAGARHFAGSATIAASIQSMSDEETGLADKLGLDGFDAYVRLRDVELWESPVPIKPLVEDLRFIKDPKFYGLHLRRAVTRISSDDFQLIVQQASAGRK